MTGFVVLHYLAYEMTLQCTESLLGLAGEKHIVIVDNASPDGSGEKLAAHFSGQSSEVTVLPSLCNEGFARGNNRGYEYLQTHFSCDFIVVLNNDVLIPDTGFIGKVEEIYKETPFAVLGPDILNPKTGIHQNPALPHGLGREEVLALRSRCQKDLAHFRWRRFKWSLKKYFVHKPEAVEKPWREAARNPVLHGACFIFSADFIRSREHAFNPATFLYFEENILHYECLQEGLTLLYSPQVQVRHLEDVSTDQAFRRRAKKEKMIIKESIRSMDVLLSLMNR